MISRVLPIGAITVAQLPDLRSDDPMPAQEGGQRVGDGQGVGDGPRVIRTGDQHVFRIREPAKDELPDFCEPWSACVPPMCRTAQ
jgi:hypothetical protein